MLKSRKIPTYGDGWAAIYRRPAGSTAFGAKENSLAVRDEWLVAKVAFSLKSNRDQDYEFAERMGFSLSMKVCARRRDGIDPGCCCVIGDALFDVRHVDRTSTEIFLYLQEVGKVAT